MLNGNSNEILSNGAATLNGASGLNLSSHCIANNNNIAKTNIINGKTSSTTTTTTTTTTSATNTNTNTTTATATTTTTRNQVSGGAVQLKQQEQQIPLKAISWNYATDVWWDKVMAEASTECEPVWVDAEDPLFILYTR